MNVVDCGKGVRQDGVTRTKHGARCNAVTTLSHAVNVRSQSTAEAPPYDTVGARFFPCSLAIFHFAAGHATRSMRTHLVDGRENRPGLLAWFHTGVHQGRGKAHLNDTYAQRQGTRGASQGHHKIRVTHRSRQGRRGASQGHQNTRMPHRQASSNACTWAAHQARAHAAGAAGMPVQSDRTPGQRSGRSPRPESTSRSHLSCRSCSSLPALPQSDALLQPMQPLLGWYVMMR